MAEVTQMSVQSLPAATLSETQIRVINSWSWGAASFSWIYLLSMKSGKDALIAFLLQWIPLINLAVFVYYGINGKKAAWATRNWRDFDDFLACQRLWDSWAKWVLGIVIVLSVLGAIFGHS
jgi:hypothetical protein